MQLIIIRRKHVFKIFVIKTIKMSFEKTIIYRRYLHVNQTNKPSKRINCCRDDVHR